MESEGLLLEDWDDAFVNALDAACQAFEPLPPPPPPPAAAPDTSYSPPRELSQRTAHPTPTKDQEIDRLKKELGRVSEQLNLLEKECSDLRKERDKEVQLKVVRSRANAEEAELNRAREVDSTTAPGISQSCGNPLNKPRGSWSKSCNNIGIQTELTTESNSITVKNICRGSAKLLDLWNSKDQRYGKDLVAKLLMSCEAEFHVLFGYLGSSFSWRTKMNSSQNVADMALSKQLNPAYPIETAKVSHLYSVLTKISNETSRLEDLMEALLDLCSLKNVAIVHGSLCVLQRFLSDSFALDKEFGKVCCSRENVIVEKPFTKSNDSLMNRSGYPENGKLLSANVASLLNQGHIPGALKLSNVGIPARNELLDNFSTSISEAYLVSVFERVCLIATTNNEEQIRREALSVMNLILMRCKAYSERERFAGELVFQCVSKVLRKDCGFFVQDHALHTLYLLCNCPKVLAMLCSDSKEETKNTCSEDSNEKTKPNLEGLNEIFTGLADSLAYSGSPTASEMKLRRNAVNFLAFLGSSGKSGFDILLNYRLPKGANFLTIILRSLVSDMELETLKSAQPSDVFRELTFFIREALIFFNRLASHPQYSVPVLQVLTSTREMASMTVDLANRLTCKGKFRWNDNKTTNQIRESEIIDLARVFKKRVFTFLGDSIS